MKITKIIAVALKFIDSKNITRKVDVKKASIKLNMGERYPFTNISTSCLTFLTKPADVFCRKNLYFFFRICSKIFVDKWLFNFKTNLDCSLIKYKINKYLIK